MGISEERMLKRFGKQVATLRKKRGLTQQDVSEATGISVVGIAYIETGRRWARLGTLRRIADLLDVDVSDFFKTI